MLLQEGSGVVVPFEGKVVALSTLCSHFLAAVFCWLRDEQSTV